MVFEKILKDFSLNILLLKFDPHYDPSTDQRKKSTIPVDAFTSDSFSGQMIVEIRK